MGPKLQPMAVQYYCHVSPTVSHDHWREFWSRDTDVYYTYTCFGIILTLFYFNFSRQEHQIGIIPEILRFQPIPPFIFPVQSLYD